jgi:hypothetical protein
MAAIKIYLDEDVHPFIAHAVLVAATKLRRRSRRASRVAEVLRRTFAEEPQQGSNGLPS